MPTREASWEQQQKHAAFFQNLIASKQQGAITGFTAAAIFVTLAGISSQALEHDTDGRLNIVLAFMFAWFVVVAIISAGYRRAIARIEDDYLREHALIFPNAYPYRLESILLDARKSDRKILSQFEKGGVAKPDALTRDGAVSAEDGSDNVGEHHPR